MPRVKALGTRDPRKTAVLELIGGTLMALDINQDELAVQMGVSPATLSCRIKNVDDMRLCELWALEDIRKRNGLEVNKGEKR